MFVKGDRVRLLTGTDVDAEGRVTHIQIPNLGPDPVVGVRWADGSQSGEFPQDLAYADHPNFASAEEVEQWLST